MKLLATAGLVGMAVSTAPPKIDLSLTDFSANHGRLVTALERPHDLGYRNYASDVESYADVKSRQDWTETCQAVNRNAWDGRNDTERRAYCPFPVARAYDHRDQKVDVTTRLMSVDVEGDGQVKPQEKVRWNERATYLFKYDAQDSAGNYAEQLVFALVLNDLEKPTITCGGTTNCADYVEAGTHKDLFTWNTDLPHDNFIDLSDPVNAGFEWEGLPEASVTDNIDGQADQTKDGEEDVRKIPIDYKIVYMCDDLSDACTKWRDEGGDLDWHSKPDGTAWEDTLIYKKIKSDITGTFEVRMRAEDHAGIYGKQHMNNRATKLHLVVVRDTLKPWLTRFGFDPTYVECDYQHNFDLQINSSVVPNCDGIETHCLGEVTAHDLLDTAVLNKPISVHATCSLDGEEQSNCSALGRATPTMPSNWTISYDAADAHSNEATQVTREVRVLDTTRCHLALRDSDTGGCTGNFCVLSTTDGATSLNDPGFIVSDTCDKRPEMNCVWCEESSCNSLCDTNVTDHRNWTQTELDGFSTWTTMSRPFLGTNQTQANPAIPVIGRYVRTYWCKDHTGGPEHHITRTFDVVDDDAPIIYLLAADRDTTTGNYTPSSLGKESANYTTEVQAVRDGIFRDPGATCYDHTDGDLNHAVVVSGDIVDVSVPADYRIVYDCQDFSGNTAHQKYRIVHVRDTLCPNITLNGEESLVWEAGFEYVDAGATATDDLDGDLTNRIHTTGSAQINLRNVGTLNNYGSCEDIADANADAYLDNGEFYITHYDPSKGEMEDFSQKYSANYKRLRVFCDFSGGEKKTLYYTHSNESETYPIDETAASNIKACKGRNMRMLTEAEWTVSCPNVRSYYETRANDHFEHSITTTSPKSFSIEQNINLPSCQNGESEYFFCTFNSTNTGEGSKFPAIQAAIRIDEAGPRYNQSYYHTDAAQKGDPKSSQLNGNSAVPGWYMIDYTVKDKAGNKACSRVDRTVVVKDSLPPVIRLSLDDDKIGSEMSSYNSSIKGHNGQPNPFIFMEETGLTDSSWAVGAIAAAVSGIAFVVHFSRSKTEIAV